MKKQILTMSLVLATGLLVFGVPSSAAAKTSKVSIKIKGKKKVKLAVGKTKKLKVKVKGVKMKKVKWTSSNKKIVTVKKGKIRAVAAGKAVVKASIRKKSVKFYITVNKKAEEKEKENSEQDTEASDYGIDTVTEDTASEKTEVPAFSKIMADFSVNTLRAASKKEESGKNLLISGESIETALAMAANGASGSTKEEMLKVLAPGFTAEEYNQALSEFNKKITSIPTVKISMANSIWIREAEGVKVNETFIKLNSDYYDADTYLEPFDEGTVQKINNWVSKKTDNMIPSIIKQLDIADYMCLINAVTFKAQWSQKFDDYNVNENASFTDQDGAKSKVTMLSGSEEYYVSLKKGAGFVKSYKSAAGSFAFVGILPPAGMSTGEYLNSFTGEEFASAILNKRNDRDLRIKLPEFSYSHRTELKPVLQEMGMTKAFSASEADFSAAFDRAALNPVLSSIAHETFIDLDRNGTRAAAVTAVMTTGSSAGWKKRLEIYLDRPFVYAIVDLETGIPIFMGCVNKL